LWALLGYWQKYSPAHISAHRVCVYYGITTNPESKKPIEKKRNNLEDQFKELSNIVPIMPVPRELRDSVKTPEDAQRVAEQVFFGMEIKNGG
jgi:hypothetical protein